MRQCGLCVGGCVKVGTLQASVCVVYVCMGRSVCIYMRVSVWPLRRHPASHTSTLSTPQPHQNQGRPRPSPYLWPAFQAGPRICLGQKLAYMEAKARAGVCDY